jgi:putative ABC transport system ATP-binding protein
MTQGGGLVEHLTLLGNVQLAASFRSPSTTPRGAMAVQRGSAQAAALLTELGIGTRARSRPSTLSGGETARANLAVALAGGPLVLLADEPTAEVSRDEETSILALLRKVRPPAGATVIVTHSGTVATAADRVAEMTDGKLL